MLSKFDVGIFPCRCVSVYVCVCVYVKFDEFEERGLLAQDHRHTSGIIISRQPESLKMPYVLKKQSEVGGSCNLGRGRCENKVMANTKYYKNTPYTTSNLY